MQRFHNIGSGNEGSELKVSRAYIAGLGTTGVLIGSFLLLLTVGSALVAFRGVPGVATNGDLSSIELRQQAEQTARGGSESVAAGDESGDSVSGADSASRHGVLGTSASGSSDASRFLGSASGGQGDRLRSDSPATPLGQRAPVSSPGSTTPGTLTTAPPSSGSGSDTSSGSGSATGSGSDTGSGSATGSGSDTGTDSGSSGSSGSGSTGSGTDTGTGTGTGSGTDTGTGTDTGSGSGGGAASEDDGSGSSSGSGSTVTDPVDPVTDTVGSVVGVVSPSAGDAASGLLDDVTSAVGGLSG